MSGVNGTSYVLQYLDQYRGWLADQPIRSTIHINGGSERPVSQARDALLGADDYAKALAQKPIETSLYATGNAERPVEVRLTAHDLASYRYRGQSNHVKSTGGSSTADVAAQIPGGAQRPADETSWREILAEVVRLKERTG